MLHQDSPGYAEQTSLQVATIDKLRELLQHRREFLS